jgi:hypothetical protein
MFEYVRESVIHHPRRRMEPRWIPGRMVAYSTHGEGPSAELGFTRRVFWVKPYDRSEDPTSPYCRDNFPSEAVDPISITPGQRALELG